MMWWSRFHSRSIRTIVFCVPVLSFGAFPSAAGVVINEIYYDHPGSDDGWEFVELYNASEIPVDLSGWRLEFLDGASLGAVAVWTAGAGTRIEPATCVCIAGAERNPAPDFTLRGILGNGPDAVRLVGPSGIVDVIGYGACPSSDFYETSPAIDVAPGLSLSRRPDGFDSDRNDADFVASSPTPGRRNFFLHDVRVRLAEGEVFPCRGSPFSLIVRIANSGVEPFGGRLWILAEAIEGGSVSSSGRSERVVDLPASAVDSVEVVLAAPESARFEVRAYLDGIHDDYPANDTAVVSLASSPGSIVINEIMYRPLEGMGEWIELANGSGEALDLRGWSVCDAAGSPRLLSTADFAISPGGFAILAKDSFSFASQFPGCRAPVKSPEGGWPSLNDTDRDGVADVIELFDERGVLVERVSYRALLGSERGRSIERISASVCSDRPGGIWHRCARSSGSTPGEENSTGIESMSARRGITISPNPFCPKRDGEAAITGERSEDESGFSVRIFGLDGCEVRRVFGEIGGCRTFSCRWDGRANDGSPVRTGLYVCLVEFVGSGGGVCRREKKCIAVAGD
jgi:hypothetical protein